MNSPDGKHAAASGQVVDGASKRSGFDDGRGRMASADHAMSLRRAFWQDMCREILTTLSVEGLRHREQASTLELSGGGQLVSNVTPEPASNEESKADPGGSLFDGRMAILTHGGERIPIGEVYPMLACGVNGDPADRVVSQAVECSIFQVLTPAGELYTVPVQEIRAFHALTPELMRKLEQAGRDNRSRRRSGSDRNMPFGFEAYTSLARAEREQQSADPYYPAP